jgi:phosphoribosylpyrophosphate synthetase
MASQTKMLLIPCSGEETTQLAENIFLRLKKDYNLEEQVEILTSKRQTEIPNGTLKDHRHELVGDHFPDNEVQVNIGRNQLYDIIRGKHIVLVEHLLTPNRKVREGSEQIVSVNDHVMTISGYLDLISNTDILHTTLVAPYLSYVRSHSIEKYRKKGFYQFDSLRKTLKNYHKDGLKTMLTIDPHSSKSAQISEEIGMDFHIINPFQSARAINPYKLGISGDKASQIRKRLRPFQERFSQLRKENNKLYVVAVDEGTENRTENFVERAYPDLSPEKFYSMIAYFGKDRFSYDDAHAFFKQFSQQHGKNIDPEGTYIIVDDMAASLRTANRVAKTIKTLGAKRVELWTSHAVTMPFQYSKANDRSFIDKVVCLDTVPEDHELDIEYIKASADLLSASLYKIHQKLMAER